MVVTRRETVRSPQFSAVCQPPVVAVGSSHHLDARNLGRGPRVPLSHTAGPNEGDLDLIVGGIGARGLCGRFRQQVCFNPIFDVARGGYEGSGLQKSPATQCICHDGSSWAKNRNWKLKRETRLLPSYLLYQADEKVSWRAPEGRGFSPALPRPSIAFFRSLFSRCRPQKSGPKGLGRKTAAFGTP